MICRDCGYCGTKDGKTGPSIIRHDPELGAISWCRLHNKEVRYWCNGCSKNDALHEDYGWMDSNDWDDEGEE